ncbi:toprim domain-containing protein [Galactobacillus timonensis]|uniref:toprim domain-containing protein n=1 Tax=Galactobacillus timonensis TaxID=2041840 RepID=UPI003CCA1E6C
MCGSGTGNSGKSRPTGAFSIAPDKEHWKCFACGTGGDIFDLVREKEKIEGFNKQVEFVAARYSIPLTETTRDGKEVPVKKTETDYGYHKPTEAGMKAAQRVIDAAQQHGSETDYFRKRGLSEEIIERFQLGFSPESQTIYIPYGSGSHYFVTRKIGEKAYRKLPSDIYGSEPLFNKDALYSGQPCFICEGPFDAMSIEQCGGKAVSIGGNAFWKLIRCIREKQPDGTLILSLDNDDPGREMQKKFTDLLRKESIPFVAAQYSYDSYQKNKDANDMLQSNPEQLKADIAANIEKAKEAENKELGQNVPTFYEDPDSSLKAGQNELRRWDTKAQEHVRGYMQPNEKGYYSMPVDGGKDWRFGISPGKYGPYVKIGKHIFPVNKSGYFWVRQGSKKEDSFKNILQTMIDAMQQKQEQFKQLERKSECLMNPVKTI